MWISWDAVNASTAHCKPVFSELETEVYGALVTALSYDEHRYAHRQDWREMVGDYEVHTCIKP